MLGPAPNALRQTEAALAALDRWHPMFPSDVIAGASTIVVTWRMGGTSQALVELSGLLEGRSGGVGCGPHQRLAALALCEESPCGPRGVPALASILGSPESSRVLGPEPEARIGIDLGNVVISKGASDGLEDTSFLDSSDDAAMRTPPIDGAFEAIRTLVDAFDGRVWIVSKAGERTRRKSLRWLDHWRFHETTGVRRDAVRFCERRPEKRIHAERERLTWFVDDRDDVLKHLVGAVPYLLHFAPRGGTPSFARRVRHWADVLDTILDENGAVRTYGNSRNSGGTDATSQTPLADG